MKIKSIISSTILVLASVAFISAAPAMADGCSAEDPCDTYAVVNSLGEVTNVIVCQPSVCGSGIWDNQKVVRQIAANPITHENQGSVFHGSDENKVLVDSNNTFIVNNGQTTKVDNEITATFSSSFQTFNFEDTIGKVISSVPLSNNNYLNNTVATISVVDTETVNYEESIILNQKQTIETISNTIIEYKLQLLQKRISRIQKLLGLWLL